MTRKCGIQVRTGKGTVTRNGEFTDVIEKICRTTIRHSGWKAIRYKGKMYQLFGGIRTPSFISLRK